jgi:4-hydroxy-tetrahydrodipicolinate reductase
MNNNMKQIIDYGLIGYKGRLGSEVQLVFSEAGHKLVFTSDIDGKNEKSKPQVLIDCSLPEAFEENVLLAQKFSTPFIIAATGLSDNQLEALTKLSKNIPVVQSFNFSVGIQVLLNLTRIACGLLKDWDVEITETHHRMKKDKPSGTAKMLKEVFKDKPVNVSSIRLGGVPGDHSVEFGGMGETLKISHHAISRRTFAEGILKSAEFILNKENGLYSFSDVLFGPENRK